MRTWMRRRIERSRARCQHKEVKRHSPKLKAQPAPRPSAPSPPAVALWRAPESQVV